MPPNNVWAIRITIKVVVFLDRGKNVSQLIKEIKLITAEILA
jgi:hypothetical protein